MVLFFFGVWRDHGDTVRSIAFSRDSRWVTELGMFIFGTMGAILGFLLCESHTSKQVTTDSTVGRGVGTGTRLAEVDSHDRHTGKLPQSRKRTSFWDAEVGAWPHTEHRENMFVRIADEGRHEAKAMRPGRSHRGPLLYLAAGGLIGAATSVLLVAIYLGTAFTFGGYVGGHMSVLYVTPFLMGLMVVVRWCYLKFRRSSSDAPASQGGGRRSWQFSFKSLLALLLVISIWFSWRAANLRQAERENRVAEELTGVASLDQVGGSFTVVTLHSSAGDHHLRLLAQLPMLRYLTIDGSSITDEGLVGLQDSQQLIGLTIRGVPITGEGLKYLAPLQFQLLTVSGLRDPGRGIPSLKQLQHVESVDLDLSGTNVTDSDLVDLGGVQATTVLSLNYTDVGDAGLKHLAQMSRLDTLGLRSTRVTDAGLKQLTRLKELRRLDLSETQVTSAAVEQTGAR